MLNKCLVSSIKCLVLSVVLLTACTSTKPSSSPVEEPLLPQKNQVWQLTSMRGRHVDALITLSFNTEASTLSGHATCNTYGANCHLTFSSSSLEGYRYTIAISNLASGNTLCPEADMNAESRYLALLPKADAILITPYNITLFQKDKEILRFELQ